MKIIRRKHLIRALKPILPLLNARQKEWLARKLHPRQSRAREGVRQYILPRYSVAEFFRLLDQAGIRVTVLRWFEDLPNQDANRDLDILIPDNAVDHVRGLLSCWPEGQRIDCYSETGRSATGYLPPSKGNIPAFPPAIAAEILANARKQKGGWWIPSPRDHALALAYHAVYLKGYASGLKPDATRAAVAAGSHDYAAVLGDLTEKAGLHVERPITMVSLDRMLANQGWRPPEPQLRKFAASNPWIGEYLL